MSKVIVSEKAEVIKSWQAPSFNTGKTVPVSAGLRTHQQNEQLRKQAYDEAFAQGMNDGLQQANQLIQEKASCLSDVLDTLSTPLRDLDEQVVSELCELAMLVAGHIVRRELKASPGEIVATVKEALSLLPVATMNVRLELHPEDALIVRDVLTEMKADRSWDIVEDPLLTRGGCRVATNTSRIDATVENRLNATIASVMGDERKSDR